MSKQLRRISKPYIEGSARYLRFMDPNVITFLGIIPPFIFGLLIWQGEYFWALFSSLLFLTDSFDGAVARMTGKESEFGAILDASLDRVADSIIISSFGFAGVAEWWIVITLITLSFSISYIKSKTETALAGKDINLEVGIMQRAPRLMMIIGSLALFIYLDFEIIGFNFLEIVFILMSLLSAVTVFQRLWFARSRLSSR